MAAPAGAYNNMALVGRSTNSITVNHRFGKLHTNKATHLARFYLDEIIADVDENGVKGYLGVCTVGSANYAMHAAARRGCYGTGATSAPGLVFSDGGLNTLGLITSFALASAMEFGGIKFNAVYKSAWYASSNISIRYRKNGVSTWANTVQFRGVAAATTYTEVDRMWNLDEVYTAYKAGDLYDVQLFITNEEGTYYSDIKTVTIVPQLVQMRTGSTPANAYNDTTPSNVYPNTRAIDVGTILYENWANQVPYAGGYFMNALDGNWYLINTFGVVTSKGYYSPTSSVSYTGGAVRLGTGSKVGDYLTEVTISNSSGSNQVTDACQIVIGKLNNSSNPITLANISEVFATHDYPSITVTASNSSTRTDYGYIEEDYAGSTWVWILTKDGVQHASGYLVNI